MTLEFHKYDGAGNDFVILDNRQKIFTGENKALIHQLCDRRRGIGADGLILLENHAEMDFRMVYFNADGNESSMCGNGGRCIIAFANSLGMIQNKANFLAVDGAHQGILMEDGGVRLKMQDVLEINKENGFYTINTGSPHYVEFTEHLADADIHSFGKKIRYSEKFREEGINVNLVQIHKADQLEVLTYERGVEAETLACGTGVTACALISNLHLGLPKGEYKIKVRTRGGEDLEVEFLKSTSGFTDIWLTGPARKVYSGKIDV